ncbi:hypothetical protein JRQ81_016029 [Phrynocephalus forsythii]|uniref:DDE-1 domain-containing protein n=1 Tax=Phrynocephalus forsythii TaxID=171643 RepID=A0A9Q1B296_9SAUR|nr:hypothetical protein JRQ81_016029 [Phrynocephalus forsythii]
MPKRTFITQEETKMPGHNPMKDHLTLLFCVNASEDMKHYLVEKNLPIKTVLLIDNAPAHPPSLEEDLAEEFSFIKVIFFLPNTSTLIQPMDKQLTANFKKLCM